MLRRDHVLDAVTLVEVLLLACLMDTPDPHLRDGRLAVLLDCLLAGLADIVRNAVLLLDLDGIEERLLRLDRWREEMMPPPV